MGLNVFEKMMYEGLERFGKYYANYIGVVTENHDPDGRGRIQVSVPKISNSKPLVSLAIPKGLWMGHNHSLELLPRIGDNVIIEFIGGSILFPIWSFGPYLAKDSDTDSPQTTIDPEVIRFKTPSGYEILIKEITNNKPSSIIQLTTPKKYYVSLDDTEDTYEFSMQGEDGKGLDIYFDKSSGLYNITSTKDKECSITLNGNSGEVIVNDGANGGAINIKRLRSLIDAIQADLIMAGSGTKVTDWMTNESDELEDKNFIH